MLISFQAGRWSSLGSPVSSIDETDCHDITKISLKVALYTITLTLKYISVTTSYWNRTMYYTSVYFTVILCIVQIPRITVKYFFFKYIRIKLYYPLGTAHLFISFKTIFFLLVPLYAIKYQFWCVNKHMSHKVIIYVSNSV